MKSGQSLRPRGNWTRVAPILLACALSGAGALLVRSGVSGLRKSVLSPRPDFLLPVPPANSTPLGLARRDRILQAFGRLPLSFEPNLGQTDSRVKFLARGPGYTLFLTPTEAVLSLQKPGDSLGPGRAVGSQESEGRNSKQETRNSFLQSGTRQLARATDHGPRTTDSVLRMRLVGANLAAQVAGLERLPGESNYFIGNDPKKWRSDVPTYARVKYEGVYPGIDLVYYGHQGQLEYDFIVAPGADPKGIALQLETGNSQLENRYWKTEAANSKLAIAANGDLIVRVEGSEIRFHKPLAYQEPGFFVGGQSNRPPGRGTTDHGARATDDSKPNIENPKSLEGRYVLLAGDRVGFEVKGYDPKKPLVIDPFVSYATYLGGSADDAAYGIAVDGSGAAYVTGATGSVNFPTASPLQSSSSGPTDAFVAKLKADGTGLVYSTYLGGNGDDRGNAIALDSSGNAYVAGFTSSTSFPATTGALQTTYGGGVADAFVAKLSSSGSALTYATYLGGSDADYARGIALDSSGNAYVVGDTQSTNFPTASPLQSALAGNSDAFVAKVKPDGSGLVYSTYLGGGDADYGQAIALDSSGAAYIAGYTFSTNFPTAQPIQAAPGGSADVYLAKLNAAGSALVYSTYFGGSGLDRAFGLALDGSGNVYLTGDTTSSDFPTTPGAFSTTNHGNGDAFVAKFNAAGFTLAYSTYLGGADLDTGNGIAVDSSGNAYVAGSTQSSDFPTVRPLQSAPGGGTCGTGPCPDAFLTELDPTGATLVYSTFLGGNGDDYAHAIALDASGNAYLAGITASANFPVTSGAPQGVYGGGASAGDAFVAKIGPQDAPAVTLIPPTLNFGDQGTEITSAAQTVTLVNSGSGALNISGITISNGFAETNNCLPSVPAGGGTCTMNVTFTPAAIGSATGNISIADDAAGSPQAVTLAGTGVTPAPVVTLSVTRLTFAAQTVSTESAPQSVTVTNSGNATLTIASIKISGDYAETHDCGTSLAAGSACTISVTFKPTVTGALAGAVTLTDNASSSTQSITLDGTGGAQFALGSNVTSLTLARGTDTQTFNISASPVVAFTGSITLSCTGNTSLSCSFNPASIKVGETSVLTVSGISTQTSTDTVSFNVSGASGNQTATLPITILLGDFTISVGPPLLSVKAGESAKYTVTLMPVNNLQGAVVLSCPNNLSTTTCTFTPSSSTLNGTAALNVTVAINTKARSSGPGRDGRRTAPPGLGGPFTLSWLAALMALAALARSRRRRRAWTLRLAPVLATILLTVFAGSCSQYYYNPITGPVTPKGTPAGTYTFYFTGTYTPTNGSAATAVAHSVAVNLTVS